MPLTPLPVVVPLAVAAALAIAGKHAHRRVLDILAIATSASVVVISIILTLHSANHAIVYWFGDWRPLAHSRFPIGICFAVDPIGAGLASLAAFLVLTAFSFSWSYFESVGALYHVLMLVFLAAMCGLALTGDLFNMFVWLEVMTAAGVALCGYKSEQSQSLQGALNFAVINTVGAFLSLMGVALLYAATGSLNLAEIGRTLAGTQFSPHFVTVALLLVVAGFLVKSAIFPFHFWLADAHAVAPTPVCILFSGVMVELGLYAIARIYWVVFAQSAQPPQAVRDVFLLMGSLTAVVGALYCFGQRHLKRMLAFSTISHVGLMLIGFSLLDARALAGMALYLVGHGLIKGALFIGAGILLHRFESMDEYDLQRHPTRRVAPIGVLMALGAWGLAGLPPFATFFGQLRIDEVTLQQHLLWLPAITIFAEAFTAAAVLRFTARVFFGMGRGRPLIAQGAPHLQSHVETKGQHSSVPAFMWVPMTVLVLGAALVAIPLRGPAERASSHFESAPLYEAAVLQVQAAPAPPRSYDQPRRADGASDWWIPLAVLLLTIGAVWGALFPKSPRTLFARPLGVGVSKAIVKLRAFQSGRVGDYVAWFAFGIAAYGCLLLLFS